MYLLPIVVLRVQAAEAAAYSIFLYEFTSALCTGLHVDAAEFTSIAHVTLCTCCASWLPRRCLAVRPSLRCPGSFKPYEVYRYTSARF
jgi:hypothetical protein